MNKDQKEQLEKVIEDRLESTLLYEEGSEEAIRAFKEATRAIELLNEAEKLEYQKESEKKRIEETERIEKKNTVLKIVEIAAVPVGLFVLDAIFKNHYMKKVCNFEKDYTFTTTAGKGLSSLFQFRRK